MEKFNDKYFQLERHFKNGEKESPEIHRIDDIDSDWKMGRRGFLISTAVGLSALGLFKNPLSGEEKTNENKAKKENFCSGIATAHADSINATAINKDSTLLATAGSNDDLLIKIWDFPSGRHLHTMASSSGYISQLRFSPESRYLYNSTSLDNKIYIWEIGKEKPKAVISGYKKMLRALAVTGDGKFLISTAEDNTIKIWSAADGAEIKTFKCKTSYTRIAISDDNYRIFLSGFTVDYAFLNLNDMSLIETSDDKTSGWIRGLRFLPDGNALSISKNGLKIWDFKKGENINHLHPSGKEFISFDISPQNDFAVGVRYGEDSSFSEIEIYSLPSLSSTGKISNVKTMPFMKIINNGDFLAGVGWDNNIYVYDLKKLNLYKTIASPVKKIIVPEISNNGGYLVFGGVDKEVLVYTLPDLNQVTCLADKTILLKGKTARFIEVKDSSGNITTRAIPADQEKPAGSLCTCDTVSGKYVHVSKQKDSGGSGGYRSGGGSHCSCNRICTCVPVK